MDCTMLPAAIAVFAMVAAVSCQQPGGMINDRFFPQPFIPNPVTTQATFMGKPVNRVEHTAQGAVVTSTIDAIGSLECDGEARYTVSEREIARLIFTNPEAVNRRADIESVTMGSSDSPYCKAQKRDETFVKATKLDECGFKHNPDGINHSPMYSNQATVVVRLPAPPHILRRKTFLIPLHCINSGMTEVAICTQWFEQFYITDPLIQNMKVPIDIQIRKVHRDREFGEWDVYVNNLTVALTGDYAQQYNMHVQRIFITPTEDRTSLPQTEFVSNGCLVYPNISKVVQSGPDRSVYEILDFALDVSRSYCFHVEVRISPKDVSDQQTQAQDWCRNGPNNGGLSSDLYNYGGISPPQQMSPIGTPRVSIGADGKPLIASLQG